MYKKQKIMTLEPSDLSEKLEKALQQDKEKEIEVDLPVDRLIIFIETVLIGSLAIATGIFVIIGKKPLESESFIFTFYSFYFIDKLSNKNILKQGWPTFSTSSANLIQIQFTCTTQTKDFKSS